MDEQLGLQPRIRRIDVAVDRPNRRDPLERIEDRAAADVSGVENQRDPGQRREHAVRRRPCVSDTRPIMMAS